MYSKKKEKTVFKNNDKLNSFSIKILIICAVIIIATIVLFLNRKAVIICSAVILISAIICMYISYKEIKDKKRRIEELSLGMFSMFQNNFESFDMPLAIVNTSSDIIWQNKNSKHSIPDKIIIDTALKIQNEEFSLNSQIDINEDSKYVAIGNKIKYKDIDAVIVGYINKTEEYKLKKYIDDTKVAVGIIFIDNYEETVQGLDEIKKAEISANITKILVDYASKNKGIITKIDKDKYIILIESQFLKNMENESTEILEKIKNVTEDTKLVVTMSLGISYLEQTLDERYKSANSALDIALGRGGDQIVIKKDKKFDFYGGTNIGVEKTSKVRARTISQAIKDTIEKCDEVYIMGHKNTDIDCIGASVGIAKIAKFLNKKAYVVVDTKCNSSTKAVIEKVKQSGEYEDTFIKKDEVKLNNTSNSVLIVVDTHKKSYTVNPDLIDEFEKVIIIDHHRRGTEFIEDAFLTYHEIYSSSTSELVSEILMYLDGIELNSYEAEALYSGIVVDTKNFMFKTGVRTFEVAAYLKKYGIDLTAVKQIFQSDLATYTARAEIVKNAEIVNGKIAISMSEEEYDEMPIIAAQAADELLSITGIIASFVLCRVDDVIMISGRSMGDINVQAILEKIGGGGHLTFAGAQIAGISISDARDKLLSAIEEYFKV